MTEIRILGSVGLKRENGEFVHSFLTGPKRLAFLIYLLLSTPRNFHRRDELTSLFWPDLSQKSARNALSNILYHIRKSLGSEIILNRGAEEIALNHDMIWCDALAFEEALSEGNVREALDLYRDDLLVAFHVSDVSNDFLTWIESERDRLRGLAFHAAWKLAEEEETAGNIHAAQRWARRATRYVEFSADAYIRYIKLLNRTGSRSEALKVHRKYVSELREKWEIEPSDELNQLYEKIKSQVKTAGSGSPPVTTHTREQSIAVLPFDTLGSDETTFFTAGMHGDIVTRLTNISDLQVISRTSVKKYTNSQKTISEIAGELNVAFILEGEIQDTGSEVRVNVRLIDAAADVQVWAQDFRRQLTAENLFNIQSMITREIASAIHIKLTPQERQQIDQTHTSEIDAYRLYVQGWSWIEQRTEKGIRRGLEYFRQATSQDPQFTLALVGQAFALLGLFGYGHEKEETVLPEAEKLINKALLQEAHLAEAHSALGLYHNARQAGPQAIEALLESVKIRPGYANAHNKLSWQYQLLGEPIKAMESAKNAVELDPFSPEAVINLAFSYLINGLPDDALREARRTYNLQPEWPTAAFYLGLVYYHLENFDEARQWLEELQVPWTGNAPRGVLALIESVTGNMQAVERQLEYFRSMNDHFHAGLILASLGRTEEAVTAFMDIDKWEPWPTHVIHHLFHKELADVKSHPGFGEIMLNVQSDWGMAGVLQ